MKNTSAFIGPSLMSFNFRVILIWKKVGKGRRKVLSYSSHRVRDEFECQKNEGEVWIIAGFSTTKLLGSRIGIGFKSLFVKCYTAKWKEGCGVHIKIVPDCKWPSWPTSRPRSENGLLFPVPPLQRSATCPALPAGKAMLPAHLAAIKHTL